METADKVRRGIERARTRERREGEGRLELTPSYFRMEKLAGVFLLFVSGLRRLPEQRRWNRRCFLRCVFVTNNPGRASARV